MNPDASLIANLKDIDTSQALEIGLAWGILVLIILAIILAILLLIYSFKIHHKRQQRQQFKIALLKAQSNNNVAMAISLLLKRCCLMHLPQDNVASLSNKQWVNFLDSQQALSQNLKHCFLYKAYQQDNKLNEQDKQDLLSYGLKFIDVCI